MKKSQASNNGSYVFSGTLSVALHAALIIGIVWGTDFFISSPTPKPTGRSIEAVVIDPNVVRAQAELVRKQREDAKRQEQARLERIEQQAALLEQQREQEEKRLRELKAQKLAAEKAAKDAEKQAQRERERIAKAKQEAEKAKKEAQEQVRLAQEAKQKAAAADAERKRKEKEAAAAEAEKQRKLAEKKQAEKAAKEAEAARKKAQQDAEKAQQQKVEQEAALNELFSGLASESAERDTARGQQVANDVERWSSRFVAIIQNNWIVDTSMAGQRCRLNLRLAPDGLVIDVKNLSTDSSLCRSAKASVIKVNQFPMPSDPDVVARLRDINLNFER